MTDKEIWERDRNTSLLVKCDTCLEEIGEIIISYGECVMQCIQCAIEGHIEHAGD